MEKLPPEINQFKSFDAAIGIAPTVGGEEVRMLRLIFKVDHQDRSGFHADRKLPEVWIHPQMALDLSLAIQSAVMRHFPQVAQTQPAEPGSSGTTPPDRH